MGLKGLTGIEIVILTIDFIAIFVFFYIVLKNLQLIRMRGFVKALTLVVGVWLIARVIGMEMTLTVLSTVMGYAVLLIVILFPEEFRKMLDRYGRENNIFMSKEKLLGVKERKEIAEAMIELSRRRLGFLMVIAKKSGLDEYIETGEYLGEVKITKDMLMNLWSDDSNYTKGAMIVRDNAILVANSQLPNATRSDLIKEGAGSRHLAALGITYEQDCVALVVSSTTGKVTIAYKQGGKINYLYALETRDQDSRYGMTASELAHKIGEALGDVENNKVKEKGLSREEREKLIKERKEKRIKERDRKKQELEEKRKLRKEGKKVTNKKKIESKPKSKGFGG